MAAKKRKPKRGRKKRTRPALLSRRARTILIVAACAVLIAAGVIVFITKHYAVKTVRVEGNSRYTDEEIEAMFLSGMFSRNTLYLRLKYGGKPVENIPFVERIDITCPSHDSVRIVVYEKAVAGYIEYLGQFMYFDREGIVVESGRERLIDVPQVMGLNFDHVVLYERLPVDNEGVFALILSITQLLDKYSLTADRIFFDAGYNIYLYFGNIEAELGTNDYIDEKLEQLVHILPELTDKRGILRMKDYTPASRGITFEER